MTAPKVNPMPIKSSCDCNRLKMPNGRKMARMVLMAMIGAVIAQAATRSFGVVADAKNSGEKYQIAITPGENAPANPKTSNSISRPLALLICSIKFMEDVCYAPNDPKLSERGGRRDACAAGSAGAGSVTPGAVRCSAWLGVAAVVIGAMEVVAGERTEQASGTAYESGKPSAYHLSERKHIHDRCTCCCTTGRADRPSPEDGMQRHPEVERHKDEEPDNENNRERKKREQKQAEPVLGGFRRVTSKTSQRIPKDVPRQPADECRKSAAAK